MPSLRRAGIAARPADRFWHDGFFHRHSVRSARRAIHVRTPQVQAMLLPEPSPASTFVGSPDMGSSQAFMRLREIDSFLRVSLAATGWRSVSGRPGVATALAGNSPRLSRVKTGVPRPARLYMTWLKLSVPAALMGF
jgi:hypothetical protein